MIFDLIAVDGETLLPQPYSVRRQRLEALARDGHSWTTPAAFEDGAALFAAVCERGWGASSPSSADRRTGRRSTWVKIKNPDNWRRRAGQFIQAIYSS